MEFLYGLIGIVIVLVLLVKLFLLREGDAIIDVRTDAHTPFIVDELTKDSVTVSTKVEFANIGTQCGTIMDCYVRSLLPYEQFDGVKVEAKAELDGAVREDDYFEAVLIQRKESINVWVKIKITARKTADIKEALVDMVDLPVDLVYQYAARKPWAITKKRIVLKAEDIAKLVGVTLAK